MVPLQNYIRQPRPPKKMMAIAKNRRFAKIHLRWYLTLFLNISTVINIKTLTNSNQQTQSYQFNSHIAAFLSVVLITEMLEFCIQTSYDQNVQLILNSYLPVVLGTTLSINKLTSDIENYGSL